MDISQCKLCPRQCGADRHKLPGFCGGGDRVRVARAALHFGEEPCISGTRGSGTVFFSGCTLKCRFCQNHQISRGTVGEEISTGRLSDIFLELQDQGAHNINLVTPSHYAPWIAESLSNVKSQLQIPVICNCSGYESPEILRCFHGLVDVYLTDLKYYSSEKAKRYSKAEDYFSVASFAIKEMFQQVGGVLTDEYGLLQKGMLIRHLVLPGGKEDAIQLLRWITEAFPKDEILVSVMRQYTPCGDLSECPELNRSLFSIEYNSVVAEMRRLGLRGYEQGRGCSSLAMTPDFDLTGVKKGN